jgi:hypothetical protein
MLQAAPRVKKRTLASFLSVRRALLRAERDNKAHMKLLLLLLLLVKSRGKAPHLRVAS